MNRILIYILIGLVLVFVLKPCVTPDSIPPAEAAATKPEQFLAEADRAGWEPEITLSLGNDLIESTWTSWGAGCSEVRLLDFHSGESEEPLLLYKRVPEVENRHRSRDGLRLWDPTGTVLDGALLDAEPWQVEEFSGRNGLKGLRFTLEASGVLLTKEVAIRSGERHFEVLVQVEALSDEAAGQTLNLRLGTGGGIRRVEDRFYQNPYAGAATLEDGTVEGVELYNPRGPEVRNLARAAVWSGPRPYVVEGSKYFLSILQPDGKPFDGAGAELLFNYKSYNQAYQESIESGEAEMQARLRARSKAFTRTSAFGNFKIYLQSGQTSQSRFTWYLGPKDPVLLEDLYPEFADLPSHVDYSSSFFYRIFFTDLFAPLLLWLLRFFEGITHNFGFAIILLTLLVRTVLFPINRSSQTKMAAYQQRMKKVQPLIDAIKEKYKDNPQKKNEETFKLYREHKISAPLGGCLPMFLQMPIFVGLFAALRCSIDLRQQPFIAWIHDLSLPDALIDFGGPLLNFWPLSSMTRLNILPIVMVVLWVVHQRTMPKPADPQQAQMQKMMTFMPILFGFMLYNYAAGLSLYMITSSALGIFEAKVIKKHFPVPGAPTPAGGPAR